MDGLQELWGAGFDEIMGKGTTEQADADTETAQQAVEDVRFSLREGPITDDEVLKALKWCSYLKAKNDTSYDGKYFPVKTATPKYILADMDEDDAPMVMQEKSPPSDVARRTCIC